MSEHQVFWLVLAMINACILGMNVSDWLKPGRVKTSTVGWTCITTALMVGSVLRVVNG